MRSTLRLPSSAATLLAGGRTRHVGGDCFFDLSNSSRWENLGAGNRIEPSEAGRMKECDQLQLHRAVTQRMTQQRRQALFRFMLLFWASELCCQRHTTYPSP